MQKQEPQNSQFSFFDEVEIPKENLQKCFNLDYYEDKINLCTPGSENDFRWRSLSNYMIKVYKFYNILMSQLNSTIDNPVNSNNFKNVKFNDYLIEKYAIELLDQEKRLMITFGKNPEKIAKKIEKHKALQELRNYGAKCWLLYQNYKRENFYHAIIDFKSRNATKDLSINRNIALMYVGHVKTKSFVKSKIKGYFSTNRAVNPFMEKYPTSIGIYANLNAESLFTEIMHTFNGYDYLENEQFFAEQVPQLTEENAIKVVELYKNYEDIKRVYKTLANKLLLKQQGYQINYVDEDAMIYFKKRQNLFELAVKYKHQLLDVFEMAEQNSQYAFVLKEVHLLNKLLQQIELHQDYYTQIEEDKKLKRQQFINNNPSFNID